MADTKNIILPASCSKNFASSASNLKTVAAESRKKKNIRDGFAKLLRDGFK